MLGAVALEHFRVFFYLYVRCRSSWTLTCPDIQTNIQFEDRGRLLSLISCAEAFASCIGEEGERSSIYIHNI